jgi:ribosome-binding factor A
MKIKTERISSEMVRELENIFLTEVNNESFKGVTITSAETTNDLSFSKIYFINNGELDKIFVEKELNKANGYFRSMLAERLDIRHMPELKFVYDESIDYGMKIEKIIEDLNKK